MYALNTAKHRLLALSALVLALALALVGCGGKQQPASSAAASAAASTAADPAAAQRPTTDRSGAAVSIPEQVDTVVTLAPALSQTLVDLGLGDRIVGYDTESVGLPGLAEDAPVFDTVDPDIEALMALQPDVLLVTSLTLYDQDAPYQPLIDAGVCVLTVPTAESIADIEDDITFLAAAFGVPEQGARVLEEMQYELDAVAGIAATIPEEERKTVYFEISAAPYLYSTGSGTYLHEMIEAIGAKNVLGDQTGWLPVEAESIVQADPDVILTNVNYIEDPVGEILGRDGWAGIAAVRAKAVYTVDNAATSYPNEGITAALWQMAAAVYPDYFGDEAAA